MSCYTRRKRHRKERAPKGYLNIYIDSVFLIQTLKVLKTLNSCQGLLAEGCLQGKEKSKQWLSGII